MITATIHDLYYGRRHRNAFRIGTYLALIRMMGVGHLVASLYGHTQLVSQTFERLSRTRQTLRDVICHGFESEIGRAAVYRLVAVHRGLPADADDFKYVLSTFILEPLRWSACSGRKSVTASELEVLLEFWSRVGEAMGMVKMPASFDEWRDFQSRYEERHLQYTDEGHRVAMMCLRDVVKLSLPRGTQKLFRQVMLVTMDVRIREMLRIAPATWLCRKLVPLVLRVMG